MSFLLHRILPRNAEGLQLNAIVLDAWVSLSYKGTLNEGYPFNAPSELNQSGRASKDHSQRLIEDTLHL